MACGATNPVWPGRSSAPNFPGVTTGSTATHAERSRGQLCASLLDLAADAGHPQEWLAGRRRGAGVPGWPHWRPRAFERALGRGPGPRSGRLTYRLRIPGMTWRDRRVPRRLRSRWRPGYWLRHPILSLVLCIGFAGLFGLMAGTGLHDTRRLHEHGVHTPATVVRVHALGRDSYVTVEFTAADGQQITADVYDFYWRPRPRSGDEVTVVYDPQSPDTILRDARIGDDYGLPIFSLALAVGLAVGGSVMLRRTWPVWLDNAEAWRTGRHFA